MRKKQYVDKIDDLLARIRDEVPDNDATSHVLGILTAMETYNAELRDALIACRLISRDKTDEIARQIVTLGWDVRISDTPDPYERDDWYGAEARRVGKRRWTGLSPGDYVQTRGGSRQEAAESLLERVREKNAARARLERWDEVFPDSPR